MTLNFDANLSTFNIKKALLYHSQRVGLSVKYESIKKDSHIRTDEKKIQHDQIIHNLKAPINLLKCFSL